MKIYLFYYENQIVSSKSQNRPFLFVQTANWPKIEVIELELQLYCFDFIFIIQFKVDWTISEIVNQKIEGHILG